jgi:hypothetical protein
MNVSLAAFVIAGTTFCGLVCAVAGEGAVASTQDNFRYYLANRPLELDRLLGKHFTSVVPGETWQGLFVPEEYRNPAIRYAVFAKGKKLEAYMKRWNFIKDDDCVSQESMFLLYFNRGYVFKIELRYLPDTYRGTVSARAPGFCGDETPLFEILSKQFGGAVIVNHGQRELVHPESTYTIVLTTVRGNTHLSWNLKDGPCFVATCPGE